MSGATYFVQECPSCGRHLQVRVEFLGRSVVCPHCSRSVEAQQTPRASDSGEYLLNRAEELLASVDAPKPHPR